MESYSVKAVLSVADQGFTKKMNAAAKSLDEVDFGAKRAATSIAGIAKGIGAFKLLAVAGDALKNSLSGAIDRFDTMNRFPKVMKQIGFSAEASDKSIQRLSDGIQGLPTSLDGITASTQKLAILTGSLEKATSTSLALNDAFLASGSTAADAERGLVQYTQMLSKGTVDIVSWRTLQETMGPALNEVAKAFGYAGQSAQNDLYAALQSGKVTFNQFNDKLVELDTSIGGFAERAKTASGGIATSLSNMGIAVVRGTEKVIREVDTSLSDAGFPTIQEQIGMTTTAINQFFTKAAERSGDFIDTVAPAVKLVGDNLDILVPIAGAATVSMLGLKAAFAIESKIQAYNKAVEVAKKRIDGMKAATELSTKATQVSEKAVRAASAVEKLHKQAQETSAKAAKAKANAEKLSAQATKLKQKATANAANAEKLSEKADRKSASAAKAKANAAKLSAQASKEKERAARLEKVATNASTRAQEVSVKAEMANAAAAEISSVAIATKTALLGVMSGKLKIAAAAQLVWNTAMKTNPIGTVITAVSALSGFLVGLIRLLQKLGGNTETVAQKQKRLKKETDKLTKSLKESKNEYKESEDGAKKSAGAIDTLTNKVIELSKKENKSASDKSLLKAQVDELNKSMDGLNLQYDSELDALNMTETALKNKAKAYKEQIIGEIYAERYKEVLEEEITVTEKLTKAKSELENAEKSFNEAAMSGNMTADNYGEALLKQREIVEKLEGQKKSLAEEETDLEGKMSASQEAIAEATEASTERQKLCISELMQANDALSQSQKDTIDRITSAYETMTGTLSNLSEEIKEDSETTWKKVQDNQADTITKTQEFATLYARAINAGVSESYLNAIGATGPEALPLLRGMMEGGIEEVLKSQTQWQQAYESIGHTFTDSLQMGDEERAAIQEYILGESGVFGTLQQAIDSADFASLTKAVPDGMAEGINKNAEAAVEATGQMVEEVKGAATGGLDIHSPSGVFRGYGENTIQGFILGAQGQQGSLNTAMKSIMNEAGNIASNSLKNAIKGMEFISSASFAKVSAATKSGMNEMTSQIADGVKKSNTAMKNGMKSMQTINQQGMKSFTQEIANGMISAKSATSSGCTSMKAQVARLNTSFYNSGYYASLGLARGIDAGAGAAIAAANRIANQVAKTMRNALEVHSPSRVTEEIGNYTATGFIKGMLAEVREAKAAAYEFAMAAIPTGEIARRVTFAGGYTMHVHEEYEGTVNSNYTIVVPVEVDGREIARVTAPYTQAELERRETRNNRKRGIR